MSPRNTRTGSVLEAMILPALKQGGYGYSSQQVIGSRFGGGRHIVDAIAEKDEQRFLISLKWQQTGGTAEQKVPFEVISLADVDGPATLPHEFDRPNQTHLSRTR